MCTWTKKLCMHYLAKPNREEYVEHAFSHDVNVNEPEKNEHQFAKHVYTHAERYGISDLDMADRYAFTYQRPNADTRV